MRHEQLFYLGVKAFIRDPKSNVLLLKARRVNGEYYFDLPGGRINKGEDAEAALAREVQEETGVTSVKIERSMGTALTTISIPITHDETAGLILSVYACSTQDISHLKPEEGVQLEWCSPDQVVSRLQNYPEALKTVIEAAL